MASWRPPGADDRLGGDLNRRPPRTLRSVIPIVGWLPRYRWARDLPLDALAGIAVAALLIPQSMGYAGVAGVPAQVGLYAALGAVLAYTVTGGTSILVVGPASAVAALSASLVAEFRGDIDPAELTAALAIASGLLLFTAGVLHLGWIVNFISRPVLGAFVAGLSISIIAGQLGGLLGAEVDGRSPVAKVVDAFAHPGDWHGGSVALGIGAVCVLLLLERFAERVPAAVVVVVVGIVLSSALDLADHGIAVVGEIPRGLPDAGLPDLSALRWLKLLGAGAALLLVGFSEGYAAASASARARGTDVDADQELIGAGTANLAAGLLGGMAVSGSYAKTAAAQRAGGRTQMTSLVAGLVVLATLLFLAPVLEDLPEPVLAAVVMVAVLRSADPRRVSDLWTVNRSDFAAGLVTFTLVLVWQTLPAMIVGVALSLAFVVRRASFPDVVEVRPAAGGGFARVTPTDEDALVPGVAILRFEAPLVYANAERLKQAARALVARRSDLNRLVLDAEMIADLDSTGADVLAELDDELAAAGITLHLARTHLRARAQIARSRLSSRLKTRMHASLREATGPTADGVSRAGDPERGP